MGRSASRRSAEVSPERRADADRDLELVRVPEREVPMAAGERDEVSRLPERERAEYVRLLRAQETRIRDEISVRDADISRRGEDIAALHEDVRSLHEEIASAELELAAARQLNRRVEESVTWQALQKARARLYRAIGEDSLAARALRSSLRLAGRVLVRRPKPAAPIVSSTDTPAEPIWLPEYENPKVSLIIPVYAHADLTRACLSSIRHHTTQVSYEVIIVDDDSDPDTQRLLKAVHGATILHNEKNLGYLRSMNRGAELARGDWLVLFNNDTEVTEGWLAAMLECAESAPDVGVVTPKFLYPDGSLNEAGAIIWRDGTGVNYGRGDSPELLPIRISP